jgi:hypothetical protein
MAVAATVRKNTGSRRVDPKPRHIDGSAPWANIVDRDPKRKYVLVAQNGGEFGVDYYKSIGYRIERQKADGDGPRLQGGVTEESLDAPIVSRGHVLMSIDDATHQQIEQHGADGNSGQAEATRIEELIVNKRRGGNDHLRGINTRGRSGDQAIYMRNSTTPLSTFEQGDDDDDEEN